MTAFKYWLKNKQPPGIKSDYFTLFFLDKYAYRLFKLWFEVRYIIVIAYYQSYYRSGHLVIWSTYSYLSMILWIYQDLLAVIILRTF